MPRPTVLLALGEGFEDHAQALTSAGFDLTNSLSNGNGRPDLAVIDCDLPASESAYLYADLHGDDPVPTLLVFGEDIPEFAAKGSGGRDEYAVKPIPPEALVYRLQALLIRGGQHLPGEAGGWTDAMTGDGTTIGEAHVISVFAPKGGVGKTTV